jgi:hypothetical protein
MLPSLTLFCRIFKWQKPVITLTMTLHMFSQLYSFLQIFSVYSPTTEFGHHQVLYVYSTDRRQDKIFPFLFMNIYFELKNENFYGNFMLSEISIEIFCFDFFEDIIKK